MDPNEPNLTSYFPSHHNHHHPHHQPPQTTTTTTPLTNGGGISDTTAAAPLYPQSLTGKAPSTTTTTTSSIEPQRRRRGRPRKYGTPEDAAAAKRAAVPSKRKEQQFLNAGGGSSHSSSSSLSSKKSNLFSIGGQGFTPHVINVAAGEDVGQKIMLFMQQSKRELCILSASGAISNASLRQPASSGGSVAYEGLFEIISLTGSYVRSEIGGKAGGLSACLCNTSGQIVGGGVGGPLIAAGPVEVIVATFVIDPKKEASAGYKGDASANKMSSLVSASTAVYRPIVESSGGFTVTGSDNHHHQNIDGSSYMMQPQWRGGIDFDMAGNTGHDSHDSPENGDYEHMPD